MSTRTESPWQGRKVVIVEAARTPIGRGHPTKGWYRDPPRGSCSSATG
ncbi:MAG TPA: hypothetical protein VG325_00960 [Solirubrobacteraceae bacterium]|nr:hypothetical protein [Solirubrobacteraceae bacterium]